MIKKNYRILFSFFIIIFLCVINTTTAWSHAIIEKKFPTPDSHLENSPNEVRIIFASKIEKDFSSIKVMNKEQQKVTNGLTELSTDQREIYLKLPKLADGIYTVEYYMVSSNDGHPVQDSYTFTVGNLTSSQQQQSTWDKVNMAEWIIYLMRALYYIGLLLIIGWVFWWRYVQYYSTELKKKFLFWGILIQMLHLVGLISTILIQLNIFTSNGLAFTLDSPTETSFGLLWLMSFFVSLIGFVCLFRNKWFDFFWIIIIMVSESLHGHSLEFEPTFLLVINNSIHLFVASIWAAGLVFTIIFWRKQRLYVQSFLPLFSRYAFWGIVILTITGTFMTIFFVSSFGLFLTDWGGFLLFKLLVVILVIITGGIIRSKLKKSKTANLGRWITLDFTFMIIIIVLVSILSYLSPLP